MDNKRPASSARISPNFDDRSLPVSMLVLHYTGMETAKAALDRLCEKTAKVSAHYLIDEQGLVFSLVPEDKRAWHAGLSNWHGSTDINSAAIGIEIVNGGHDYGLPAYPNRQIKALIELCQGILRRHAILPNNIVGHNEIAPARKLDPGEQFPWAELADAGVGLWPTRQTKPAGTPSVSNASLLLEQIGYGVKDIPLDGSPKHCLISEFQRRYLPDAVDGILNKQTLNRICTVAKMYRDLTQPPKTA